MGLVEQVCGNMGYIFARGNEFMFLMLGETVLQIAIASTSGGGDFAVFSVRRLPAACSHPVCALGGKRKGAGARHVPTCLSDETVELL